MSKELPRGWARARLSSIGQWYGGGTPSKLRSDYWESGTIPWISPKDMGSEVLATTQDRITPAAIENSATRLVPPGSVAIVVRSGILERRLPVAVVPFEAALNQDMRAVKPYDGIDPRWVAWCLRSLEQDILQKCRKVGTTVASIELSRLMDTQIPLAPTAEQARIIATLERQLGRLDAGRDQLSCAQRDLGSFARFIIDAELRVLGASPVEPLGALLREPLRNGHSARAAAGGGIRTITLSAVTRGEFSDRFTKMTAADESRIRDLWMESGDIFIQRSNTPELVGTSALYRGPANWAIFPDLLIRIRLGDRLVPDYLALVLKSTDVRRFLRGQARGNAGSMPKIDQRVIETISVPVPSTEEQRAFISRISLAAGGADRLASAIQQGQGEAESLRQALLRAGADGRLEPQDPAEEPASAVVERIEAKGVARRAPRPPHRQKPLRIDRTGVQESLL